MAFTFIDLFAGVGGFHFALSEHGAECLFASEINPASQITYKLNHEIQPFGDITLPDVKAQIPEDFDILCAGFPCQPFSVAGKQQGFDDVRGTLFFDIADIVNRHKPKVVFLENVKNLLTHDKGNTFSVIKATLENLGYYVHYQVLNAQTYANVPQNRERVFVVALNQETVRDPNVFSFPEKIRLRKTIQDCLVPTQVASKYYYTESSPYYGIFTEQIKNPNTLYQWRRKYVRENMSQVCPTLTANMGTGGHNVPIVIENYGIRKLTPLECFNFQGFPSNFKLPNLADSKLYQQAGNSVTVPLVSRIAGNIIDKLS